MSSMSMLQLSPLVQLLLVLRLFLRLFSPMLRAAIKEDMLVAVTRNFLCSIFSNINDPTFSCLS